MAMLHLCLANKLPIGVAHCNFKLRKEADEEEAFIRDFCEQAGIPIYIKEIPIAQIKRDLKGASTQMIARQERYEWFEEMRKEMYFDLVATAHHKNDLAETLLNNLIRGTGIAGTHGIRSLSNKLIRPLLCFTRPEIEQYLKENEVPFREDASNKDTKYQRNYIRHEILPHFEKLNPQSVQALSDYARRIEQSESLLNQSYENWKKKCIRTENGLVHLNVGLLNNHPARELLLYELLKPYGFNGKQVQQIGETVDGQSGKHYLSDTHRLMRERNVLTIMETGQEKQSVVLITESDEQVQSLRGRLKLQEEMAKESVKNKDENLAFVDKAKLVFPLSWRPQKNGDYFYPLGLKKPNSNQVGKKKLSKYFKDQKFSQVEKEQSSVLVDAKGRVLWLVGQRLDDRFKITDSTKTILRIAWSK